MRTLLAMLSTCLLAARVEAEPGQRRLLDEVVAVVEAQSITLSELAAETRIELVMERGPDFAGAPLSRGLLAASLRKLLQERVVLAEVDRLRIADQDHAELDKRWKSLRDRFPTQARYDQFLRSLEMTDDEVQAVLAREVRVERYLDNRLRLASQLRESELSDAARPMGGLSSMSRAQQDALRRQLGQQKYDRLLLELLAELRKRTAVRVLDPIETEDGATPAEQ